MLPTTSTSTALAQDIISSLVCWGGPLLRLPYSAFAHFSPLVILLKHKSDHGLSLFKTLLRLSTKHKVTVEFHSIAIGTSAPFISLPPQLSESFWCHCYSSNTLKHVWNPMSEILILLTFHLRMPFKVCGCDLVSNFLWISRNILKGGFSEHPIKRTVYHLLFLCP